MTAYLASFAATMAAVMALDLLWLGVLARDFYRSRLSHLMSPEVYWPAAILFYAVYAAGILYFAAAPSLERGELFGAALNGALLGFLVYAVYDLTNMAVLRDWPAGLSLLDVLWGAILTSACSCIGFLVLRRFR